MAIFGERPSKYCYVAYIDEAGDPSIDRVQPRDPRGATEWLSVGAVLIRTTDERAQVQWVKEIHKAINSHQGAVLHFRKLSDRRREKACKYISALPLRAFVAVSNKANMEGYRNPAAERYLAPRGWFYNWCIRVVLERVSDFVERNSIRKFGEPCHVKLVFSERGGVKYRWLSAYIELLMKQARDGNTFLSKRTVKYRVLHPELIEVVRHNDSAGAQLADCIASAFYSAAHARGSRWNMKSAELLKPCSRAWLKKGARIATMVSHLYRGTIFERQKLTSDQRKIFEFYQYRFK
jgi:hypothetical protein